MAYLTRRAALEEYEHSIHKVLLFVAASSMLAHGHQKSGRISTGESCVTLTERVYCKFCFSSYKVDVYVLNYSAIHLPPSTLPK